MDKKKTRVLPGLAMAVCMAFALIPTANVSAQELSADVEAQAVSVSDATGLQNAVNGGGVVELENDITLSGQLTISNAVTINGNNHTITYNGTNEAVKVMGNEAVVMNSLKMNATGTSGRGIGLYGTSPQITLNSCTLTVDQRGISLHASGNEMHLTLNGTTIQSSRKPEGKTYENWSDQADSRGLSLWNMKHATVTIENNSEILGFGYPINLAGDTTNNARDTDESTINILNSKVWGWCALNIWTVDTTYNITNSSLKGFVETSNEWNSFAAIVLNENIYTDLNADETMANVFNISGGDISSTCVGSGNVFHILFRLDEEFLSEFNFLYPDDSATELYCSQPYSAFVMTYSDMTEEGFEDWAATKLSVEDGSVTYNHNILAPGVSVDNGQGVALLGEIPAFAGTGHEGGQNCE